MKNSPTAVRSASGSSIARMSLMVTFVNLTIDFSILSPSIFFSAIFSFLVRSSSVDVLMAVLQRILPRNCYSRRPLKLLEITNLIVLLFAFFTVCRAGILPIYPDHNCSPNFPASCTYRSEKLSIISYTSVKLNKQEDSSDDDGEDGEDGVAVGDSPSPQSEQSISGPSSSSDSSLSKLSWRNKPKNQESEVSSPDPIPKLRNKGKCQVISAGASAPSPMHPSQALPATTPNSLKTRKRLREDIAGPSSSSSSKLSRTKQLKNQESEVSTALQLVLRIKGKHQASAGASAPSTMSLPQALPATPPNSLMKTSLAEFGMDYRRSSAKISQEKKRFVVVIASGSLNQQRNEIIDVRVVSSLPSTHIVPKQTIVRQIPHDVTPQWIHSRFFRKLNDEGVLVLKGLDSKLSKNLPPDLQKLRCEVAFHALRFAPPIRELGDKLTRRMWIEGLYVALHLRLEKGLWVRTGCRTGLGPEVDRIIAEEQESRPEYLTGRLNINYDQRRLAGLCPLNAAEVARLLKALGAPRNARIYIAGGEPLGGNEALLPVKKEFPDVVTKDSLAKDGELAPYINRSSALAAIDYSISLSSDVFMPSHGGKMSHAMQGHRAYIGHRKYIRPNKRATLHSKPLLSYINATLSEGNFSKIIKCLHKHSLGQPQWRNNQREWDVIAYPVPECMCNS